MSASLVADRYARGLYSTIQSDAEAEFALAALEDLTEAYNDNASLQAALRNPAIALTRRESILLAVAEKTGAPEIVANLARTLVHRHRVNLLPQITDAFSTLVDARLNRVTARVTTAITPTPEQRERVRAALEKWSGKHVEIKTKVDPKILGGVIARIDGAVVDGSLRTRLKRLKEAVLAEEQ